MHDEETACRRVEQRKVYPEATVSAALQGCTLRNGCT